MNEKDQKAWRKIMHGNVILNSEDAVKLYEENKRLREELSLLCPIADFDVITSLKMQNLHVSEEYEKLQKELKKVKAENKRLQDALYTALKKIEDSK